MSKHVQDEKIFPIDCLKLHVCVTSHFHWNFLAFFDLQGNFAAMLLPIRSPNMAEYARGLCLQLPGSKYILPGPLNLSINCCLLLKRAKATEASIKDQVGNSYCLFEIFEFLLKNFDQTNVCSCLIDRHAFVNFSRGGYCAPNRGTK